MIIRKADKFDIDKVIDLVKNFYDAVELDLKNYGDLDLDYVNKLYHHIILGAGTAIVAEHEDKLVGIILALKNPNIFYPDKTVLNELLIYVEPEHRKSSACYKMLSAYKKVAEEMVEKEEITTYTVTKTEHLDQIKFEKLGYRKSEEVWVAGI
jgi:N-acetylglutamate synthase-like GNAT family acetyltransferase